MAELDTVSKSYMEKPVFVRRSNDDIMILSTKILQHLLRHLKFNVSLFEEDNGSFTGILEELDLTENAPAKEDCISSLLEAMKEYAQDFYNEFSLWSSAPNRKDHVPYVLKILSSSDDEIMEDIVCQICLLKFQWEVERYISICGRKLEAGNLK